MAYLDPPDPSNGYEALAKNSVWSRSRSAIGTSTVREWARGLPRGAEVLEQHEPIMATGATDDDIRAFVARLVGRPLTEPVAVVRGSAGPGQLDAVAGATVSSSVMADAVVTAARAVARHAGLIAAHGIDARRVVQVHVKAVVAAGLATVLAALVMHLLGPVGGWAHAVVMCVVGGGILTAAYVGLLAAMRVEELTVLVRTVAGRLGGRWDARRG